MDDDGTTIEGAQFRVADKFDSIDTFFAPGTPREWMPSRRALLTTLCTATTAGLAGCGGRIRTALGAAPPEVTSCDDGDGQDWTWPTAGGDAGRTGRTDTAPPPSDADVVDLLAGAHYPDGQRLLASSLPAVGNGTAYVPASGGIASVPLSPSGGSSTDGATDAGTGRTNWVHDLDDDVDAMPALSCGFVLAPGLNRLVALDPASGEIRWRSDVGAHGETAIAATDGTVYVAGSGPVAVDARTGTVRWRADGGDTLAVGDGVYTTQNVNGTGGIFAHDLDGERRWQLALGKIVGSASVLDGTVYVADNSGTIYAIDAATGTTHWSRAPAGVGKIHSGLAVRGEDVVVPAGIGETSVVLTADTGEPRWQVDTGIVTGRPVVGEDWVAFGRTNAGVTVYDRSTGRERVTWSRDAYHLGTIDGIAPVEEGFLVREGTTSGLALIR